MADLEKVIKEAEEAIDILAKAEEPTFWLDFVRIAFENALSLLKAQEPRVIKGMKNVGSHLLGTCPSCEKILMVEEHPKFCGRCGQAVKWDE